MNPEMYRQRQVENQKQAETQKKETKKANNIPNQKTETSRQIQQNDEPAFEIFGIKLYFDDILIIALIFFLYNEGVRDNFLFLSLILILLS